MPESSELRTRSAGPNAELLRKLGSALYESVSGMSGADASRLAHVLNEFTMQNVPAEATAPLYLLAEMAGARGRLP